MFTQVAIPRPITVSTRDPSYLLLGALFVMGLGMGVTMMPIMTSALQTLKDAEIARGSTLMNITQQVAASIGTALFSVILTNGFNGSAAVTQLRAAVDSGGQVDPRILPFAYSDMSDAFAWRSWWHDPGRAVHRPGAAAAAPQAGRDRARWSR